MNKKVFTLNSDQEKAAEELMKWLMRTDSREIILSGPGGVGKSYLISYLIDVLIPKYESLCELVNLPGKYEFVNLTATSNKAADGLAESTNKPVSTIHSFLGLIVKNDFNTGKTYLQRGRKWQMHHNTVLIVDEYSMENHDLWKQIKESTVNCKIIHVGDHCQLSAVGDTVPYVSTLGLPMIELTQQERTKNPILQAVFTQLRNSVQTLQFSPIQPHPGVIDVLSADEFQAEIEQNFKDPVTCENMRILAYSNNRVNMYNGFIRDLRNQPNHPISGEHLISNSAYTVKGKTVFAAEEEVFIAHIADVPHFVSLPGDAMLEVRMATLTGRFGTHTGIEIPCDRAHFADLVRYYKRIKDWATYFKLQETYPDLRPKESCTVHKSQGSSYDTVYIDAEDLSTCTNISTAARLLYVGFSRTRHRVVFYGKLANKLGGIYGQT